MEIDIRNPVDEEITAIRIENANRKVVIAELLIKGYRVHIQDSDYPEQQSLAVISEDHAKNIIKALQKAIDLGWWKV